MARRIQVAILSDARLFGEALSSRLALEDAIEVVSSAGTVYELLMRAEGRPIEVLLVHLHVRPRLAVELVWDVKTLLPAARVVVLGFERGNTQAVRWIEAGAMAWLGQESPYESLLEAVHAVSEGRILHSADVLTDVIRRMARLEKGGQALKVYPEEPLTERQSEVAQLMHLGLTGKEIARHLGIRLPTVKSHASQVLKRWGVARRGDLDLRRTRGRDGEEG